MGHCVGQNSTGFKGITADADASWHDSRGSFSASRHRGVGGIVA
jgi:hypothetical protein